MGLRFSSQLCKIIDLLLSTRMERRASKSFYVITEEICMKGKRPTKSYHHHLQGVFSESRMQVRALLNMIKAKQKYATL
jgi:hypothetical protein